MITKFSLINKNSHPKLEYFTRQTQHHRLHRTLPHSTVPHRTSLHSTVLYHTYRIVPCHLPFRTVRYGTVPYNTIPYPTLLQKHLYLCPVTATAIALPAPSRPHLSCSDNLRDHACVFLVVELIFIRFRKGLCQQVL